MSTACNMGFCASGANGINIGFVLLSSAVPADGMLRKQTNDQLFYSTFG